MNSLEEKIAALSDEINSCGIVRPDKLAKNKYSEILDSIHEMLNQKELMLVPANSNLQTNVLYGLEDNKGVLHRRTRVTADVEFLWLDVATGDHLGPFHGNGEAQADFEEAALKAIDVAEWNHLSDILSLSCN